jgi:FdhE protein
MSQIIRDGSLAGQIPAIPAFRPASPYVFAERAERLAELAAGHPLEGYLRFAASLSVAQHKLLAALPELAVPDEIMLAHCLEHGLPPLSVDGHRRDPLWREALTRLIDLLDRAALPAAGGAVIDRLPALSPEKLEAAAVHLLAGAYADVDPAQAPFVGAALQAYWVKMGLRLSAAAMGTPAQIGLCPVCGSHPVASVVRIGGAQQGLRYLVCSLCCSEWHMVRVKCSACGSTKGISYFGVEGADDAIKAECCDQCKTYLKIFYLEKNTGLVPTADDLASLALDMLVDEAGYDRLGPNLLFAPGHSAQ